MKGLLKSTNIKIIPIILIFILVTALFSGCGNMQTGQSANSSKTENTEGQAGMSQESTSKPGNSDNKYPMQIKDATGTSVTISAKPVKIISMPLGTCEMLMSLVDKESIAAMTNYVDDANVSNIADTAKGVGQRLDSNAEKIISMQPDLVFVDSWAQQDFIKQLRDAKLTVMVLNVPSNVDQEEEMLRLLGKITDEESKAEQTISWMDQKLKEVNDKLTGLKEDQKLTILDYSEMGSTSGKGTNFDDVVKRAGLINPVSRDGVAGWPNLSKEMVVKYNPDIISLPSWYYDKKVSYESLAGSIKGDKALAGVRAVKNNKLISIPYKHISSPSQYSVLAVEDMAKAAYPELFK